MENMAAGQAAITSATWRLLSVDQISTVWLIGENPVAKLVMPRGQLRKREGFFLATHLQYVLTLFLVGRDRRDSGNLAYLSTPV